MAAAAAQSGSEDRASAHEVDEYGDPFIDFGFLSRVEELRAKGNAAFQNGNYQAAMKEYDCALDQLLTVAFDKSIVIGRRKWDDVVVTRSSLRLNKSTCLLKLQQWDESAKAALECLHGSIQETMLYSDASVRAKVRQAQQKNEASLLVEDKLPKTLRAKAWFRLAKCYLNLGVVEDAWGAWKKAAALKDDAASSPEFLELRASLERLQRRQARRQKKQFEGFFEKLQDQGGYADSNDKARATWNKLSLDERRRFLETLDDSGDEESPGSLDKIDSFDLSSAIGKEVGPTFEELMQANADAIGRSN